MQKKWAFFVIGTTVVTLIAVYGTRGLNIECLYGWFP